MSTPSAASLREEIKSPMAQPAKHMGIRRTQDIFRENEHRLYDGVVNREVLAANNLAERDLRPSVIARRVSFGLLTDAGARVRSILTTVAATIKKRGEEVATHIERALDLLARDPEADLYPVLFPSLNPPLSEIQPTIFYRRGAFRALRPYRAHFMPRETEGLPKLKKNT